MRNEQQRLHDEVGSVRSQSTHPSAESFHSAERVVRRAISTDIFYDLPPRRGDVDREPMTLSDLKSPKPSHFSERIDSRRSGNAMLNDQPTLTMSRFPVNNSSVSTVLSYPSKSDAPTITTWKIADIDAFERYCRELRIIQYPHDEAWRAIRNVFPFCTIDTLYRLISMSRSERQLPRVILDELEISDVIQTLRGVAAGKDINAT